MRPVPEEIQSKLKVWFFLSNIWNNTHNVVGGCSAAMSVVISINAKAQFLSTTNAAIIAAAAAILTFLVTTLHAQTKGKAFTLAERELEAAIAKYRIDDSLPEKYLGEAKARGVEVLIKNDIG